MQLSPKFFPTLELDDAMERPELWWKQVDHVKIKTNLNMLRGSDQLYQLFFNQLRSIQIRSTLVQRVQA